MLLLVRTQLSSKGPEITFEVESTNQLNSNKLIPADRTKYFIRLINSGPDRTKYAFVADFNDNKTALPFMHVRAQSSVRISWKFRLAGRLN